MRCAGGVGDAGMSTGLSSLTMVLNALAIDPGRVWKGPWRWMHESMLDCCGKCDETVLLSFLLLLSCRVVVLSLVFVFMSSVDVIITHSVPLEEVKSTGVTFDQLTCLAVCNGATCNSYRATNDDQELQRFRRQLLCVSQACGWQMIVSCMFSLSGLYRRRMS